MPDRTKNQVKAFCPFRIFPLSNLVFRIFFEKPQIGGERCARENDQLPRSTTFRRFDVSTPKDEFNFNATLIRTKLLKSFLMRLASWLLLLLLLLLELLLFDDVVAADVCCWC